MTATLETIVVGVDGSEGGAAAREFAAREAAFRDPGDHADRRQPQSDLDELSGAVLLEHGAQPGEGAVSAGEGDLDERAALPKA